MSKKIKIIFLVILTTILIGLFLILKLNKEDKKNSKIKPESSYTIKITNKGKEEKIKIKKGDKYTLPNIEDNNFLGWYKKDETKIEGEIDLDGDLEIYAKYEMEKKPDNPPKPKEDPSKGGINQKLICDNDYDLINKSCVKVIKKEVMKVLKCPKDAKEENGKCVMTRKPNYTCEGIQGIVYQNKNYCYADEIYVSKSDCLRDGNFYINGRCFKDRVSANEDCPNSYLSSPFGCRKIVSKEYVYECEKDFIKEKNFCYKKLYKKPILK